MPIITLDGQAVSKSASLAGITSYARKHCVIQAYIFKNSDESGILDLVFHNGAVSSIYFGSYTALKYWIEARLKDNANFHGADYSYQ